MNDRYSTIDAPATSEFVLSILRDEHRQQCQYDPECDPGLALSFDTTVAEWQAGCDLLGWRQLGLAYNRLWDIECSDADWYSALMPAKERRLADVCQLIAKHAVRRLVRPSKLLGRNCTSAGAFLTIRSLLHDAGAPMHEVAPSTPLAPFTRRYAEVFLGSISRLAPGLLPNVRIRKPVYDASMWGIVVALLGLPIGAYFGSAILLFFSALLFASSYAVMWYAARCMLPASVEFGELRTFRDLAMLVAKGNPAEQSASADGEIIL